VGTAVACEDRAVGNPKQAGEERWRTPYGTDDPWRGRGDLGSRECPHLKGNRCYLRALWANRVTA
jgi:hypothetical protein